MMKNFFTKNRIIIFILAICILFTYFIVKIIGVSATNLQILKNVKVPIVMYHSVLESEESINDYTVSVSCLEEDMIYLKNNNYNTVTISDLIDYVYNNKSLPENPIVLTFDDGHYNNLMNVLPLLEKYNMKASISVVGVYAEKYSEINEKDLMYGYLDYEDIKQLVKSKRVDIGHHSNDLHTHNHVRAGALKNKYESIDQYNQLFMSDTLILQTNLKENCKINTEYYTYPFGFYCKESEAILREIGFKASLTCNEKTNYISKDPDSLFLLNRYNRSGYDKTENFMKKVLE